MECVKCGLRKLNNEFLYFPSSNYTYKKCNDCRKQEKKQEYKRNKEKYINRAKAYQITYRQENKEKVAENRNRYRKEQRIVNPQFLMKERLHSRLRKALWKTSSKEESTLDLLGCTLSAFVMYIERKFYNDMSWAKRNFEIDHIIPCSWFDLTQEKHRRMCFHYTNLQPLTKKDNLLKLDKVWVKYDIKKNPYI